MRKSMPFLAPRANAPRGGGSGTVVSATAVVSFLNYLYTITLIWLLPPRQYVVFGSISALLLIWGTVSGAAVPWALAREVVSSGPGSARRSRALSFAAGATLVQALGAGVATCLVAMSYAAGPALVAAFGSVVVIFGAASAAGYLQGLLRFRRLALLRTAEVVVKIGVGVGLVLLGERAAGAVAGFAAGAIVVAAGALLAMRHDFRWDRSAVLDRDLWSVTGGLFYIQAGAAILASLDIVIGSLVLGRDPGFATYQAANVLGRVPLYVGAAISVVAFPLLSRARADRVREVRESLWLFVRVSVPVLALAATVPAQLVEKLFPATYGKVALVLPWAALAGIMLGLVNLATTYFQAAGIVRRTTATLFAGIVAGGALDYAGLRAGGNRGLAAAVALGAGAVSISLLRDTHRNWPGSLRSLARTALGAALLGTPLWFARHNLALWLPLAFAFAVAPAMAALLGAERSSRASKPRVLHLGYEDPFKPGAGGGSVRAHEINKRLAHNFDITVVCARYRGARERAQDGVHYVHAGLGGGYFTSIVSYFLALPFALLRYRSDLVVEDFGAPFSSVAVPWLTRRPVIGVVQWLFAREKAQQYGLPFHLVERAGVRAHRHLVAVSDGLAARLRHVNPRAMVSVVPNGVDRAAPARDRRRSGIAYLGRLEIAQKGLDMLLHAFAKVAPHIPQDLTIGGDGPDRGRLEALAAELGVSERVHFVGRVRASERLGWLAGAELLAMPSRYETFGMVAAEALAAATPVVAFDIPCLRELVDDSTGVVVPACDVDAFAAALRRLARDHSLARQLGEAGPPKVAHLDWDRLARQQAEIYSSVLGASAGDLSTDREATGATPSAAPGGEGAPAMPATAERTVVELFEQQALLGPEAPAISDGEQTLSYAELAHAARQLAHTLAGEGLGAGSPVGVYMERRASAIVAALAVMEAGCVYVPLDPAYPTARLETIRSSAQLQAVVVGEGLDWPLGGKVLRLRDGLRTGEGPAGTADAVPLPSPSLDDPAYMIFTSGSTGTPKGVLVTHANLSSMLTWLVPVMGKDIACVAADTSLSFDPSIMEVFGPLVAGGRVELVQEALLLVPEGRRPTFLSVTPSLATELLRANRVPSSVRTILLGGEVLPPSLARDLLALPHVERVFNAYGPTEATVVTTLHEVRLPLGGTVPIGKPVPGTEALVAGPDLQPVAKGEVGELVLLGPQVAAGYVNDSALTEERFVELRGRDGTPTRAYRTGDLVRQLPDGALEYHGRRDRQVKVRGFRVELADVEATLLQLPRVSQAAVRASGEGPEAALVAYVVPKDEGWDERAVRSELRDKLASYLVPTRFVTLPALPLTRHGKLDEAALAAASSSGRTSRSLAAENPSAPLTTDERVTAGLIQKVLGLQSAVRPSDDFLDDLGGTSLTLVRLLAKMEEVFRRQLPIRSALEDTTVAGLAKLAGTGRASEAVNTATPSGSAPALFIINPYLGSAVRFRRFAAHLRGSTPVVGLQVQGAQGTGSVPELAREALAQVKAVQPHGPYLVGGHSAGGLVAVEVARLLKDQGDDVLDVLLIDSPVIGSWLDHIWAEWALNWPVLRDARARERVAMVRATVRTRLGKLRRSRPGLAASVERATRRTNMAVRHYRPTPYSGQVTLLWTAHGRRIARGRPQLGWEKVVNGQINSRMVSGEHISMFDPPYVAELAEVVQLFVDRSTAGLLIGPPSQGPALGDDRPGGRGTRDVHELAEAMSA
jgi:amino acid adenylation domain-containing protein